MDTRVCKDCQEEKSLSEFPFSSGYYRWNCKPCERARIRAQYHNNIEYHKARNTKYRQEVSHGLGPGGYEKMLADQNGRCKICGALEPGSNRKYFSIDHDHNHCPGQFGCSECVRGLLCTLCNVGLGAFSDDINKLEAAIGYLTGVVPRP